MLHRESHRFVSCLTSQLSYNIMPPIHCQQQISFFLPFIIQYQILYLNCSNCTRHNTFYHASLIYDRLIIDTPLSLRYSKYIFSTSWHSVHITMPNIKNILFYVLILSCLFIGDPFHVVCNTIYQNLRKRCSAYYFINYKTNMKN